MAAEMGAPVSFAGTAQVGAGIGGFMGTIAALKHFSFTETYHAGILAYEPIGDVGLITPWHWPLNQTALKVAPELDAGNTMVDRKSDVQGRSESVRVALGGSRIIDNNNTPNKTNSPHRFILTQTV